MPTADEESPTPVLESTSGDGTEAAPDQLRSDSKPSTLPPPDADQRLEKEPTEAKPTEAKPTEAKPTEAKPTEAKPTEAKPTEAKPTEAKPAQEKPGAANLFDEAKLRRRSQERLAVLGQAAMQQERLRKEALRQHAMRLLQASPPAGVVKPVTHLGPDTH